MAEEDEITLKEAELMLRKAVNRVAREAARLRAAGMLSPTADAQIGQAAGGAFDLANHAASLEQFNRRIAESETQWD